MIWWYKKPNLVPRLIFTYDIYGAESIASMGVLHVRVFLILNPW